MRRYEAMFIVKTELSGEEKKSLMDQINDTLLKNNAQILQVNIWAEKRKLAYPIKKHQEGTYYLISFTAPPEAIAKLNNAYRLNENILRVLITSEV
ncbi:MAG: 30S ribosomal protein S6 [Candidatus Omnitrophica bacterium]|nr:30S ribosomal protein S6 [Candidatus Omnitrophota bacterium]